MRVERTDWGSIKKSDMKAAYKDGIRLINGRQVNLLVILGAEAGYHGDRLLEFLEFQCEVKVDRLEDVPDGEVMTKVVAKLRGVKEEESQGKRRYNR